MGFWNKIGKVALTIMQEAPELLNALAEEGAKKQGQAIKNAERKMNEYERKASTIA